MAEYKQKISQGLYIISTPIGNLADITIRALETIKACDLLLCEDTRVTAKLLQAHGISAKLESYNDVNAAKKRDKIISELQAGKIIALVSDAGTPLISDPGYKLVKEARDLAINCVPIPGASAPIAALSASGLPSDGFLFSGFFDAKKTKQYEHHLNIKNAPTLIFFESAKRLTKTLQKLSAFGDIEICVAREITKMFEEFKTGNAVELLEYYNNKPPKGEIVLLISKQSDAEIDDKKIITELKRALKDEKLKKASEIIAEKFGIPKKRVYELGLSLKN